jgi:beta-phosphoglucomutase-like phosphatase (HAD superfamily)
MTDPIPPFSDLDGVLRQARHLLIDFDGPVCDLWAGHLAALAADQLRKLLTDQDIRLPDTIAATPDPLAVLSYAATISPDLAETTEADLTGFELSAVPTAQPAGYANDVITSARASGRTVTVISSCSEHAVNAYLTRNSLDGQVGLVVARTTHEPHPATSLIEHAITALHGDPAACMLLASSPAIIEAANAAGTHTIGYARTPSDREHLSDMQASAVISSLADLVLRLRARPLQN